ncbi:DNA-directed RNA polymerase I, II, and III subunit RPABC1 [Sphaeroforma arctica JP610]|uniref:DNA-directed RNA polymerase I, II, and III subunit RPABC1 n=1 Tax=Sphaeroforma arctica JP610 TaxID=667725 RepID=A0A0L0GCL2_9EUKA|nr:DNA-directed RNA polymerase I, II, and III subunit RPABC1 [Sphaeroforma arctica JP610]KNC86755.1 DNA-directed RNA polymerase I, II, and III subunit RPABC1 [Sphaeroforma arctica JP610]|eukprot:XP_014160657.1 DNA-directed RNA polymerase I, II, and III subunit RPABC1 [Sphaeroforma arctica JP610]
MEIEGVDKKVWRLWRIRKTLMAMLHDRKYLVSQTELELSFNQFLSQFTTNPQRDALRILVSQRDDQRRRLYVFFPEDTKLGIPHIKAYSEEMEQNNVDRGIIVIRSSMTPFAKSKIDSLRPKIVLESFLEAELLVNITEHCLVPRHIVLNIEEKTTLLKRYKLKETQLPRMQRHDPVARYFGLDRGDVVKIIRPSETAGRYMTYRLVM